MNEIKIRITEKKHKNSEKQREGQRAVELVCV